MDGTVSTTSKETLTWLSYDWRPAWIYSGPLEGQGYAQSITQLLKERLSEFHHKELPVINVRTYSILQNLDACFAASSYMGADLSAEQKEGLIWSAPTFLFFYHGIILHADSLEKLSPHIRGGFVRLSSLVEDPAIIGLYQPGRRYSRWIMPILHTAEAKPNIFRWSSNSQLTEGKFKMLEARRLDYFIDYGFLLQYHKETTYSTVPLLHLPLEEHTNTVGLGAIACNATPVGHKAIAEINALLLNLRNSEVYKKAASRWLIPEGMEQEYWQLWKNELLTKTR